MKFETKYAPKSISEFVFPTASMKSNVELYVANQMDGHLLMHGNFGTGKTTLANLLPLEVARKTDPSANQVWFDTKAGNEINVAATRQIKLAVCMVHPQLPRQVIVIDEADTMTPGAMKAMKNLIDDTQANCSFIFCTNYLDKINGGIVSRCVTLSFDKSDVQAMTDRAQSILAAEGVVLSDEQINSLVNKSNGDFRKLLQMLEQICFRLSQVAA